MKISQIFSIAVIAISICVAWDRSKRRKIEVPDLSEELANEELHYA